VKTNGVHPDSYKLLLFPFSLKDKATQWLESFPRDSINNWDDLVTKFLAKFYPPQRVIRLKTKVQTFTQMDAEPLYEAWERYKALIRKCPLEMFNEWDKLQNFYEGLTMKAQEALDYSAGGSMKLMKTAEEAQNLINMVANNQYFFAHQRQRQPSQRKGVMELEGVDSILAQNKMMQQQIQQQFDQMAKRIDSLQVAAINTSQSSTKWGQNEENQEDQQHEQPQYVHNQSCGQNEVYGDTYNPSWKNHPNIRWGDNHTQNQQPWQRNSNQNNSRNNQNHNQQNTNPNPYRKPQNNHPNSSYYPPNNQTTNQNTYHQPSISHNQPQASQDTQRISNLEILIEKMMKHQDIMMEKLMKNQEMARQDQETARKDQDAVRKDQAITSKNQEASIRNLETQMEQVAKQITEMGEKQPNASPSATQNHPRDKGKATKWEECKAIIVGSEKTGEKEAINQEEHNKQIPQEETEERSEEDRKTKNAKSSKRDKDIPETQLQEKKEGMKPYIPKLPYPQRFKKENEDKQYSKFLNIFKTLSINIPFLEALEQMPLYAKFMKEVLTKKRPLKE